MLFPCLLKEDHIEESWNGLTEAEFYVLGIKIRAYNDRT
jgi:hypothetical protein